MVLCGAVLELVAARIGADEDAHRLGVCNGP